MRGMNSFNRTAELPTTASRVEFGAEAIRVILKDERVIEVPLAWYPRLEFATAGERSKVEMFGSGVSLYWPELDEELRVDDLLMGHRSLESPASLARWQDEMNERRASRTSKPWGQEAPLPS
ncbi:DUF2442 domain-containing protein [Aeoliella sp. SH292]|uniref:DUF2442 domain-containing protein n=1 Tax=Aeoliella sp. SH292 TaxID=3454464 RepID=UPI003F9D2A4F